MARELIRYDIRLVNVKRKEPFDLYIGRANKWLGLAESKWSNPFVLERESDRSVVLERFREYFLTRYDLIDALPELEGKTLGCYCSPKMCHGNVLIEMYERFVLGVKRETGLF